jgi:hypothetical protein
LAFSGIVPPTLIELPSKVTCEPGALKFGSADESPDGHAAALARGSTLMSPLMFPSPKVDLS